MLAGAVVFEDCAGGAAPRPAGPCGAAPRPAGAAGGAVVVGGVGVVCAATGAAISSDRITASYDQGLLTRRIQVAEQAKPRKVEITAGTDAQPAISTSG